MCLTRHARAILASSVALVLLLAAAGSAAWALTANDPKFTSGQQWPLARIGAAEAWTKSTGAGVTIGIVDTGVDLAHEDLGSKVAASTNCVNSNGDPSACTGNGQDDNGHGSHVSGIAAAVTGNGKGIAGVAPDARLVVAKALDNSGAGNTADINAGIEWVVSQGAKIVNLSLGPDLPMLTPVTGSGLESGIEYAWNHGAIPVLAAGNTNILGIGSANYGDLDAVVVGATGPDDEVASAYSSPTGNAKWALVAPGGDGFDDNGNACGGSSAPRCVLSTYWRSGSSNSYGYDEGTSMAAPHVTGALALLLAQGLGQQAAVDRLLASVATNVSCGSGSQNCHGRLDAAKAVGASSPAQSAPSPSPTTTAGNAGTSAGPTSGSGAHAPTTSARPPSAPAANVRPQQSVTSPTTTPGTTAPAPATAAPPATVASVPGATATGSAAAPIGAAPARRSRHSRSGSPAIAAIVAAALAAAVAGVAARHLWLRRSVTFGAAR